MMKLVTAADVWYTQQQKTLDEIAEKLGGGRLPPKLPRGRER